jgi:hypothetical protein
VADRNAQYIIDDVTKQQEAGAAFIDVNAQAHDQFCMNYLKTVRSGAIES